MTSKQDCVILNKVTLTQNNVLQEYNKYITDEGYWHKFIIKNIADLEKHTIMKGFMDSVYPAEFLPIMFKRDIFGTVEFLAKSCEDIIKNLINNHLEIRIQHKEIIKQVSVDVLLLYCPIDAIKIDFQPLFSKILTKRFNTKDKVLNLEKFHRDEDLKTEYCSLSQPKLLNFILHLSASFKPKCIKLGKNYIRNLSSVLCLDELYLVEEIDLRYNLIETVDELKFLKPLPLKRLNLDGNPLCKKYFNTFQYVVAVKYIVPNLTVLDSINLMDPPSSVVPHFLCFGEGLSFVNKFLKSFFTAYDSRQRYLLAGLYHPIAMFSMTTNAYSRKKELTHFENLSRNLNSISGEIKRYELIKLSQPSIIELFMSLPVTDHDIYTFHTDLLNFTDTMISLVVSGVFRELNTDVLNPYQYFMFTRHFILQGKNYKDYVITNEMLHVSPSCTSIEDNTFLYSPRDCYEIKASNENEECRLKEVLIKLTNINKFWARSYISRSTQDLRNALNIFIQDSFEKKIPDIAFESKLEKDKEKTKPVDLQHFFLNMMFKQYNFNLQETEEAKTTNKFEAKKIILPTSTTTTIMVPKAPTIVNEATPSTLVLVHGKTSQGKKLQGKKRRQRNRPKKKNATLDEMNKAKKMKNGSIVISR